ncbi:MAG: hypothetical protein AAGG75_24495 [Bacteroidota bacterium]
MKNWIALGFIACLLLLINGCIPSIHPLYTQKDLIKDDRIVGTWGEAPKKQWIFKALSNKSYGLSYSDEEVEDKFVTHLLKLGDNYYLDFYPQEDHKEADAHTILGYMTQLPVHNFAKLEINETQIQMHFFDTEWLEKLFEQRKIRIKHEKTSNYILLTAPTKDLQQFILKYADEEAAYSKTIILNKQ